MQAVMQEISDRLNQELDLYRRLLEVAAQERDILLGGDHQQLMGTAESKLELCRELALVQQERRRLMEALSPDRKRPLKLSDLAGMLPASQQGPVRSLITKLRRLARRLAELNQMNKGFIEEALDTVEGLLHTLTGGGQGASYGSKGVRGDGPSLPRLVTREV